MSTSDICNVSASKSNNDVCEVNNMLNNMSTDDTDVLPVCANCGKEGISDNMNTCNKCKVVKYCNATCKKVHKKKHKKDCDEHIRLAAEKHDEKLFKQPQALHDDCPICFLRLPCLGKGSKYYVCCGKVICNGCIYAPVYDDQGNEVDNQKCPFCRTQFPISNEEMIKRQKKRVDIDDPLAMFMTGCDYQEGTDGFTQNYGKAFGLFYRAGELGCTKAYTNIGYAYTFGCGVEIDKKKAEHFYELAAMGGNVNARHNLGIKEENAGNMERALKHYMIAVRDGQNDSLEIIKRMYKDERASKDEYARALQSYQMYLSEIKSKQRDEAAAYDNELFRYY